jgi:hypothetical protein
MTIPHPQRVHNRAHLASDIGHPREISSRKLLKKSSSSLPDLLQLFAIFISAPDHRKGYDDTVYAFVPDIPVCPGPRQVAIE